MADQLKEKGNEAMKRGLYKSAKQHYTDALELKRDYLCVYTNRALACLKLEQPQQVIDDCSRVLDYCEVFEKEYNADLVYKALMRRGQALKFQKDFDLAIADFKAAQKLQKKGETDADKWVEKTESDKLHQQKIAEIMENANSLAGKEYIDYLVDFLKGKKDAEPPQQPKLQKRKQIVIHELTSEEGKKLAKTLEDEKMVYYFSVNDGFQVLVDSLYLSTTGLQLLEKLLDKNTKLQEDFQKAHLYEALIDFLQSSNENAQGKTLDYADMLIILHILESGSMNESVRMSLSDKKKIKDLFLVVINSIEISKNKELISSLV